MIGVTEQPCIDKPCGAALASGSADRMLLRERRIDGVR
jgi:hypothetical protein